MLCSWWRYWLEFNSLMACKKKLFCSLLVQDPMLRYRLPEGNSERNPWFSWLESLIESVCFAYTLSGVVVLERNTLRSFVVEGGAVSIPGGDVASQDAHHGAGEDVLAEEEEPLQPEMYFLSCLLKSTTSSFFMFIQRLVQTS